MWITECEDGAYYYTRAENHGAIYISKLAVEEVNNKTRLSMSFWDQSDSILIKLMSSIMGVFIKGSMTRMVEKDLQDIKAFVEKS